LTGGRPICVVTGATGAIGPSVVAAFLEAGFDVRALSRSVAAPQPGVTPIAADISDREALRRAFAGSDCVVHLASLLHITNPPPELVGEYRRINVEGTANVVAAAEAEGVRRLVHVSTIAVYGYATGSVLTEDDPVRPDTMYAETKLQAEQLVGEAGERAVILRLGAVYGARVKGNYRRLLLALRKRRFVPIGRGGNRRTLVYDGDVARAALLAAQHPAAAGELFNVTDGEVHTVREILDAMTSALGMRTPRIRVPEGPVRLAVSAAELVFRTARLRPIVTRAAIDKYLEDVAVSGEKIQAKLGFEPRYGLEAGWRETVSRMRAAGEL